MKKIILFLCCIFLIWVWQNSFAGGIWDPASPDFVGPPAPTTSPATSTASWATAITVKVTESIPGWNCNLIQSGTWAWLYECKIQPGFKSIQEIMWNIIKWLTAIAALAWVLFIVVNGIMLSTGSDSGEVKKRIVKGIIWLILVLLSGLILNMIAPWVYR